VYSIDPLTLLGVGVAHGKGNVADSIFVDGTLITVSDDFTARVRIGLASFPSVSVRLTARPCFLSQILVSTSFFLQNVVEDDTASIYKALFNRRVVNFKRADVRVVCDTRVRAIARRCTSLALPLLRCNRLFSGR
jgi:hypothetical protein